VAVDWLDELLGTPVLPELLESFGPLSCLIIPPLLLWDVFEFEPEEELELKLELEKKDGLEAVEVLPPLPLLLDLLELLVVRMSEVGGEKPPDLLELIVVP